MTIRAASAILFLVIFLTACGVMSLDSTPTPFIYTAAPPPTPTLSNPILRQGERSYATNCAHCHGYNGEGQKLETIANTERLGMKTVPAHDSSGTTWKHADELLFMVIRGGVQNPLNQYQMPSYAALPDAEIWAIIAFMKTRWTDEQRAYQRAVTLYRRQRLAEAGIPYELTPSAPQ
jgi:mono/diheme cytochrome c family protein